MDPKFIPQVEEAIFEKFPTVTVMNLADVLKRIQEAVDQVAVVVRFLALFAIGAGLVILCSSVAGTRYRRIREVAILKSLGGTRMQIGRIFSVEFSVLGLLAGLAGGILANRFHPYSLGPFHRCSVRLRLDGRWGCGNRNGDSGKCGRMDRQCAHPAAKTARKFSGASRTVTASERNFCSPVSCLGSNS